MDRIPSTRIPKIVAASSGTLSFDFDAPVAPPAAARTVVAEIPQPAPVVEVPFNESEAHRHACEVRYVAAMGYLHADEYCRKVSDKRGRAEAVILLRESRALRRQMEKSHE